MEEWVLGIPCRGELRCSLHRCGNPDCDIRALALVGLSRSELGLGGRLVVHAGGSSLLVREQIDLPI